MKLIKETSYIMFALSFLTPYDSSGGLVVTLNSKIGPRNWAG